MKRAAWLLVIAVLPTLVGCGYTAGGPFRNDIKTIYVEIASSHEFRRDIEFQLTEALEKRINRDTPYTLAPRNRADTVLTTEIVEVRQAAWAPDPYSRLPREKELTLIVRVQWKDQRNGEMLIDVPVEAQSADYLPPAGETDKYTLERVADLMAGKIVRGMYNKW